MPEAVITDAREVGATIAVQQQILLTGGECNDNGEVKNEAVYGANRARLRGATATARIIGILPSSGSREWDERRLPCSLFLVTGLTSVQRDPINGTTPDVAIVFPGGPGTLCELAFALLANKQVLYWKAAAALREELGNQTMAKNRVDEFLETALRASRTELVAVCGITEHTNALMLRKSLVGGLQAAADFAGSIEQLVERAVKLVGATQTETTFPGFKDDAYSKCRFDQIVQSLSNCP